ncbi:2-hydroxyacid dehydrogenase [Anaerocolumna sp. MB42-C2]|uniref:2-hydroxyacid dehydrogenase n=1 Tax=Anaerocolumna sp. MB42-C2 TaxID=3070997 RepID=UPI0027DF241E|nr:2-hydroxyacid dehydrogenase [Anaerocolumna sp. MB42-C2]WMJ90698.1 2-hydroxyacid dehydrogenase [Anaerocolumna sp. MB42-C2]
MNVVLLESLGISKEVLDSYAEKLKEQGHNFAAYEKDTDTEVMVERAKEADIVMIANMPLKGEVISRCKNLKFIDVAFTGVDHVDLETAKSMGIAVSNASGYSNESVAELVMGMILSLLRNVPQVEVRCREGKTKDGLVGRELKGKTVGVVGTGAIGSRTAELCHAFGCNILAYDLYPKKNAPEYIKYVTLEELLSNSDIVTLHCPLTEESRHLINKERIALMRPKTILINAARGPVVDSDALAEALNNDKIGGAGIDVFEIEPPLNTDHPLLHSKNTIVTPHIAFASEESMKLRAKIVFENIDKWMNGEQVNTIL